MSVRKYGIFTAIDLHAAPGGEHAYLVFTIAADRERRAELRLAFGQCHSYRIRWDQFRIAAPR